MLRRWLKTKVKPAKLEKKGKVVYAQTLTFSTGKYSVFNHFYFPLQGVFYIFEKKQLSKLTEDEGSVSMLRVQSIAAFLTCFLLGWALPCDAVEVQYYRVKQNMTAPLYKTKEDARLGIAPLKMLNAKDIIFQLQSHAEVNRFNEVQVDKLKGFVLASLIEPIECQKEWETIENSQNIELLQRFIEICAEEKRLSAGANQRIEAMRQEEAAFWAKTVTRDSTQAVEDYYYYLERFANVNSEREAIARQQIEAILKAQQPPIPKSKRHRLLRIFQDRRTERIFLMTIICVLMAGSVLLVVENRRRFRQVQKMQQEILSLSKKYNMAVAMLAKWRKRETPSLADFELYATVPDMFNGFSIQNAIKNHPTPDTFFIIKPDSEDGSEAIIEFLIDKKQVLELIKYDYATIRPICKVYGEIQAEFVNIEIQKKGRLKRLGKIWRILQPIEIKIS